MSFWCKGFLRFLLHFIQAMCCSKNPRHVKLYFQSSEESHDFYLKSSFVDRGKILPKIYHDESITIVFQCCFCEILVRTKLRRYFNHNFQTDCSIYHRFLGKKILKRQNNRCHINSVFKLLSFSYKGVISQRKLDAGMIEKE